MVRNCPSPVSGESFTVKSMLRVGSSTSIRGRATGCSASAIVSPMSTGPSPTRATMSPASASSTSTRPSLSKTSTLSIEPGVMTPSGLDQRGLLAALDPAGGDPADGDPADVVGEVERRAEHLQAGRRGRRRGRDLLDDQVEQRLDVARGRRRVVRGEPALARGEDVGEVELVLVGAELDEGVEDLVEDLVGPGVGAVDLVDDDDRPELVGERLAQDELRLGHRPLEGVDQHEDAVGHLEGALDLAAEVGVAGVSMMLILRRAVVDGDVLGQDRDAPLALLVVGVEDALARRAGWRGTGRTGGASRRPASSCRGRRGR